MPLFRYEAVNKEGDKTEGEVKFATREEALEYIMRQGLLLISLREEKDAGARRFRMGAGGGISIVDKYILFNNLNLMLRAGLSAFESMRILKEDARKKAVRGIAEGILSGLEQGRPLSEGFAEYQKHFSPVTINLLRAGEASGNLDETTRLIAIQYKKENNVRRKIRGAMIYPIILMMGSILIVFGLLTFIVPRLSRIFLESNVPLHPITKVTLALSKALSNFFIDAVFLAILFGLFVFFFRTQRGKSIVFWVFSRLPFLKKVYRDLNLYRFCWALGALIGSGLDILKIIDITAEVLTGTTYKNAALRVKEKIARGVTLGQAIEAEKGIFPVMVSQMAVIGEKTGGFEKIFLELGDFFEERFDDGLGIVIALFEPLLLMAMGLIVAVIAISVILPIYSLVSGVGGG